MATSGLRFGIIGCGPPAKDHADRLRAIDGVSCVGCADGDGDLAREFAGRISSAPDLIPVFEDTSDLLLEARPDALLITTPDRSHYRAAMDGLQAGCHLFLVTPLSTNVQEAVDIVGLARARDRKVALAHGYRHQMPLMRARELIAEGAIGGLRLVTSTLAITAPQPGGALANVGIDWIDALLWTTGRSAETVSAAQTVDPEGLDLITVASIRMAGGVLASVAISGASHRSGFEVELHGDAGQIRATDRSLSLEIGSGAARAITGTESDPDLFANFVDAIRGEATLRCAASETLEAVRVLEAIARSAAIGQFVGLA